MCARIFIYEGHYVYVHAMCVCMYAYMYVCMYVLKYVCMCVCK